MDQLTNIMLMTQNSVILSVFDNYIKSSGIGNTIALLLFLYLIKDLVKFYVNYWISYWNEVIISKFMIQKSLYIIHYQKEYDYILEYLLANYESVFNEFITSNKHEYKIRSMVNSKIYNLKNDVFINFLITENPSGNRNHNHIMMRLFTYNHSIKPVTDFVKEALSFSKKEEDKKTLYFYKTFIDKDVNNCKLILIGECSKITFDEIFNDNKRLVIESIDNFNNNIMKNDKQYVKQSLNMIFYGTPGNMKTTMIKAIANYTKRSIVMIDSKTIKDPCFYKVFTGRYDYSNYTTSHKLNDLLFVIEDIDGIFDSKSLNREIKNNSDNKTEEDNNNVINMSNLLNEFDGPVDYPGRMIIITTNKIEELDDALIRPGRMDLKLEFKNATKQNIKDIYYHYHNKEMSCNVLDNITDYQYSFADIYNKFVYSS